MNQQERLALAVRAEIASSRANQANERATAIGQQDRAAWGPEDYARAVLAYREASDLAAQAAAMHDALMEAWEHDGAAGTVIEWVGCSTQAYERAVAEALVESISRS